MENSVIIERVPGPPGDPRRNWRLRVFVGGMRLRGIMFAHEATRSGIQLPIDGETLGTRIRGPPHMHPNAFSVLDPTYVLMAVNPPVDATGNPAELLQADELNGTQRVYTHVGSQQTVRLIAHRPNGDGGVFERFDENAATELDFVSRTHLFRALVDHNELLEYRINEPIPMSLS